MDFESECVMRMDALSARWFPETTGGGGRPITIVRPRETPTVALVAVALVAGIAALLLLSLLRV